MWHILEAASWVQWFYHVDLNWWTVESWRHTIPETGSLVLDGYFLVFTFFWHDCDLSLRIRPYRSQVTLVNLGTWSNKLCFGSSLVLLLIDIGHKLASCEAWLQLLLRNTIVSWTHLHGGLIRRFWRWNDWFHWFSPINPGRRIRKNRIFLQTIVYRLHRRKICWIYRFSHFSDYLLNWGLRLIDIPKFHDAFLFLALWLGSYALSDFSWIVLIQWLPDMVHAFDHRHISSTALGLRQKSRQI